MASDDRVKNPWVFSHTPLIKLQESCKEPHRASSLTFIISQISKQTPGHRKGHTQGHTLVSGTLWSEAKCTNSHTTHFGSSQVIKGATDYLTPVKVLEQRTNQHFPLFLSIFLSHEPKISQNIRTGKCLKGHLLIHLTVF